MATVPDTETFVTVGVDTHKDTHLAVALDQLGRWLDAIEIPTTSAGYAGCSAGPATWERSTWSGSKAPAPTARDCAVG